MSIEKAGQTIERNILTDPLDVAIVNRFYTAFWRDCVVELDMQYGAVIEGRRLEEARRDNATCTELHLIMAGVELGSGLALLATSREKGTKTKVGMVVGGLTLLAQAGKNAKEAVNRIKKQKILNRQESVTQLDFM